MLLKATRFELNRRGATLSRLGGTDHDDLAHQSANDALVAILRKLGDFRGESRFTTWAYKFALLETGVKVRRRAWQGREVQLEPDSWSLIADDCIDSGRGSRRRRSSSRPWTRRSAATSRLTSGPFFVAVTLNDVPIDVLAERLETTRGALYKTIHDARRKLRAALAA